MVPLPFLTLWTVRHKSTKLTRMGLALGTMGTLVRDTPTRLFAGLCRVVAGRHLSICSDGLQTSWGCGLLQPKLLPVPDWPSPALGSPQKTKPAQYQPVCLSSSTPWVLPLEPPVSRATSGPLCCAV